MSSRLVLQCHNSLKGLSIHNRVQLFWVLGHCGIIGNEETDGLAGVGSKSDFYKVWRKRPCLKLARFLRNLPRTKFGVLIGLVTGYVRLNKHLDRIGLLSDPTCAACSIEEELVLHFICKCPTLANLRTERI
jgi:hypothetical protein